MNCDIRAVVVRWRGGDEVRRCLLSLMELGGERLNRVVLVDSGSGDGGAEGLAAKFPDVEVIALTENHGFAHAADRGAREGNEDLLLVLNPDAELTEGALDNLAAFLDQHQRAAGVVPLLEDRDGASQYRWQLRRLPTPTRLALGLPGSSAFVVPPEQPAPVPQPAAAAWMVRRTVWEALGGLDPTFTPAWWEDVDFCARLAGRLAEPDFPCTEGFWVQPGARVRHIGGSSVSSLSDAAFLTAYYRNLLHYATRHHDQRAGIIRSGLRLSLRGRMILRPSRRAGYRAAVSAI